MKSKKTIKKSVKKPTKKFVVHYSFYMSDSVEVEAENEEDAKIKVDSMISTGELADDLNKMEIGEMNIWID